MKLKELLEKARHGEVSLHETRNATAMRIDGKHFANTSAELDDLMTMKLIALLLNVAPVLPEMVEALREICDVNFCDAHLESLEMGRIAQETLAKLEKLMEVE